jgi:fructuronate reductase
MDWPKMPTISDVKSPPRLSRDANTPRPKTGIVHLGPGAFFKGFNAVFSQNAMQAAGGEWGICAVSLRSARSRDDLMPQDMLYHSVTLGPDGMSAAVVECLSDVMVAPENPAAVLAQMARSETKIVSLTITEKGYCHAPATGRLRRDDLDIEHDLVTPDAPRTAIGFLVHALAKRRLNGDQPFTILSCDNLPDNGQLIRSVVLDFANLLDPELSEWIAQNGAFPSTMVDRITPATTEENILDVVTLTGFHDPACVLHEPFAQWVIEDTFVDDARPAWDLVGAELVQDVAPFEAMKLRCLNGSHSTLAYLGYLAGYETIAQTVADRRFSLLLDRLWQEEVVATVTAPQGVDVSAYCADLKRRFENPSIAHKTWQIAMDGSQKLPQRLLGTLGDNLAAGRSIEWVTLAVAAWMRYVGGVDEAGQAIDVRDPMADDLCARFEAGADVAAKVNNLLSCRDIFSQGLAQNAQFRAALCETLEALMVDGTLQLIQKRLDK